MIATEHESLKPTLPIHEDYTAFAKFAKELPELYETLPELLKERNVEKLKKFDEAYSSYAEQLPKYKYLTTLTESSLFEAYKAVLLHDTEMPF